MAARAIYFPRIQQGVRVKNILVATDFSDAAAHAVPCVRTLAKQYGSQIFVCHILDPLTQYAQQSGSGIDMHRKSAEFKVYEWCQANGLQQREYKPLFMTGEPSDAIQKIIKKEHIDLVVLGTRGAEGIGRVVWGSMAEEIFRDVECPVLVVGPQTKPKRRGTLKIECILYPSDLSPNSRAAAPYVSSLIREFGAEVVLLHLLHPDIQSPSERQRMRDRLEPSLRHLLPKSNAGHIRKAVVEYGSTPETIVEFAKTERADLIVLGVRGGGAFSRAATHVPWAIAHKVIANSPCPVLTIRAKN